jgi:putative addiction module killer protein
VQVAVGRETLVDDLYPIGYKRMLEVQQTKAFARWFGRLADVRGKAMIAVRIDRLAFGHAGDARPVGGGVSELRIDHGPGYRVYFTRRGKFLIMLLCGGDKASQRADIKRARAMLKELEDQGG